MPRIIGNWRKVLWHSYSLHLNAAGFLCIILIVLETVWPLLAGVLPISPIWFAVLAGIFSAAGFYARFVLQPKISGDKDAEK